MSNSILYYPTIEFRHEDYQWLWNAALFADKIYRIVPPGYELNCTPFVRQCDILSNKWGDFICQRAYRTNGIHRSSRNT